MEVGLMEIVRAVNRSWIYDTYSAYIDLFIRGKCPGELSEYRANTPPNKLNYQCSFRN